MKKAFPFAAAFLVIALVVAATFIFRSKPPVDGLDSPLADASSVPGDGSDAGSGAPLSRPPTSQPLTPAQQKAAMEQAVATRQAARDEFIKKTEASRRNAESAFKNERVDPAWAPAKETELTTIASQGAFETAGVKPRDLSVSCRSSMCRIDGSFATSGQAEDWVLLYMSSVGSALPNSIVSRQQNSDGSTSVVVYGRAK